MGNLKIKCLEQAVGLINSFLPSNIEMKMREQFMKEGSKFDSIKEKVLDAYSKEMLEQYPKILEAKMWIIDVIEEIKQENKK